jgi:hypothetical protein
MIAAGPDPVTPASLSALPGKRNATGDDEPHAGNNPTSGVLPEHHPGQHRGQHGFEVEQQRSRACACSAKPDNEQ